MKLLVEATTRWHTSTVEVNVKIGLKGIGLESVEWNQLAPAVVRTRK
jgi:hypothetical protein